MIANSSTLFKSPVKIMGIVNTTPDSFSDGGKFDKLEFALHHVHQLIADGADIIDIGGESTRPGSTPVSLKEELDRVIPLVKAIRTESNITISIDTTKSAVAQAALEAGADIINDISALREDKNMLEILQASRAEVVIMHMQGSPQTMQQHPTYQDVLKEVYEFLARQLEYLVENGIEQQKIIIDPGIGFGKTLEHNLTLLRNLSAFKTLGTRVLLGHSRKRFLGELTGEENAAKRDSATAVTAALCASRHVDIIRVHNVAKTREALQIAEAIRTS